MSHPTKIRLSSIYQDHFRSYLSDPSRKLYINSKHLKAVNKSLSCRSSKLGIAVYGCDECGDTRYVYRSCKHRFCSRCGSSDTTKWAEKILVSLLNIKHHHVIFTLPSPFRFLSKKNGDLMHNMLFRLSAKVLQDWFKTKHNLRAGIVSVLHTSGSDLKYHPHTHMIVSGGGQDLTDGSYRVLAGDYLVAQRYLANQLKLKFRDRLIKLFKKGELKVPKKLSNEASLKSWINQVSSKHWIVSIQKPLEDIQQIVGYVGRYTRRSCISEYKIKENGKRIVFEYNDYKNTPRGEKPLISRKYLRPSEFLDKLLQHVPDPGYKGVRYYGLYNSYYRQKLPKSMKVEVELEAEHLFEDENYEWGEHESLRKAQIERGNADPLHCVSCNKSMVLRYYKFSKYDSEIYEYDSS